MRVLDEVLYKEIPAVQGRVGKMVDLRKVLFMIAGIHRITVHENKKNGNEKQVKCLRKC
jgi:hypothetical protein